MFIKKQISHVIRNQFPEFARDEYPGFINFLELYYKYLQQSEFRNFDTYKDIDQTIDVFIDKFKSELGLNIPTTDTESNRFLLKHIKDLYTSKGSEESFRILFRHFFNQEIEILYPQESILKASDGRWNQDVSIIINQISGDVWSLSGKHITISTTTQNFTVFVNRIKASPSTGLYEVFLAPFYYGNVSVGDIVTHDDFEGTVQPSVSKISITKSGTGFYVGQLFDIDSLTGSGTRVKVTKVGSNGELQSLQIIKYGVNYDTDFYASIVSGYDSVVYEPLKQQSFTRGFKDYGSISKQTYFLEDYTNIDYCGEIMQSFYNDYSLPTDGSILNDSKVAILNVKLDSIQKYPGYYTASHGFLSDSMYLEDNHYYQIYSYVIRANESINRYRDIVKSLLHPAGLALFGEYNLKNTFDLSSAVQMVSRFLTLDLQDEAYTSEDNTYWLEKPLADSVIGLESNTYLLEKPLSDTVSENDNATFWMEKTLSDIFTTSESYNIYASKILSDSVIESDSITSVINKLLSDIITTAESLSLDFSKILSDESTASDSGHITFNGYFSEDYAIDYASLTTIIATF